MFFGHSTSLNVVDLLGEFNVGRRCALELFYGCKFARNNIKGATLPSAEGAPS